VDTAIVGCGAVTEMYYAPALTLLQDEGMLRVSGLFDPDPTAVARVGAMFPAATRAPTFDALLRRPNDLVIVASPPHAHAIQTAWALHAGCAVLCEKPLATTVAEAEKAVRAATESGRVLAVGMLRRLLPATRVIKAMLADGTLGTLRHVTCFEGGPLRWPVQSAAAFDRSATGGGVLIDIGTHVLDLFTWWLGPPTSLRYEDDAMGGVEANCRLRLGFPDTEGEVWLSRDWARPNRYVFTGTRGWLSWIANEGNEIETALHGAEYVSKICLHEPVDRDRPRTADVPARNFHQTFVEQIRHVIHAARGEPAEIVSGAEALATVSLIDRCYRTRTLLSMPWLTEQEHVVARRLAGTTP
jgi:myo-inositol 2-dehydrogenase / D-chiro-inositol 1-dehydrogenase